MPRRCTVPCPLAQPTPRVAEQQPLLGRPVGRAGEVVALAVACLWGLAAAQAAEALTPPATAAPSRPATAAVDGKVAEVHGVVALRISQSLLQEAISGNIHRHSPVDRVVLGTRSAGTATTTGRAEVDLEYREEGIAFAVDIRGRTVSRTTGRRQPAIIHSCSHTDFTARKLIVFDGREFHSRPAAVQSRTQLSLLGIDSVLPGLRGRIVRRVGWSRAQESLPTASRIVSQLTHAQLQQSLDAELDRRIDRLNRRLQVRGLLLRLATGVGRPQIAVSSTDHYLTIAYQPATADADAPRCPMEKVAPAPAELWIRVSFASPDQGALLPAFAGDAPAWLAAVLPDVIPIANIDPPEAVPLPPLEVLLVDEWIVVRIGEEADDPADNR